MCSGDSREIETFFDRFIQLFSFGRYVFFHNTYSYFATDYSQQTCDEASQGNQEMQLQTRNGHKVSSSSGFKKFIRHGSASMKARMDGRNLIEDII